MKKFNYLALFLIAMSIGCTSKKSTPTAVKPTETTTKTSTTVKKSVVTDAQFAAVSAQFAGVTREEMEKGHSIYYGACLKCHGTKNISNYNEEAFLGIFDDMSKKAKLNAAEKQAVTRYAMGIRASLR